MGPLIEVEALSKRFGAITAVDNVSFAVGRGDVLGFLGPNGAGKTTTMRVITGYLPPSGGAVAVCGADIRKAPIAVKRRVGYLPEGAPLYPDMTPAAFLDFVASVRGFSGKEKERRIAHVVERMELGEVLHRRIETLSKGFKRRVGLAQAIIHDPEVLILDEPTDGLDPNQKHEVRRLIAGMGREKAIVISTHILEEVDAVCTRAIIIARGRIVADDTPEALRARSDLYNAVVIRLDAGLAGRMTKVLESLPEVSRVESTGQSDGKARLIVIPRDRRPIADAVGTAIRSSRIQVDELYTERGQLDDVFRQITQS